MTSLPSPPSPLTGEGQGEGEKISGSYGHDQVIPCNDERVKDRQNATIKFWKDALPNYKVYISEVTVKELEDTKDETLRRKFKGLIKSFKILKSNKKIRDLANAYIEKGVFPEKYLADALHVAVASFYEISYIVSWNFEHLVKVKTRKSVNLVNILEGYREIEIVSPQEL